MTITVKLDTKALDELMQKAPERADEVVRATALIVEARAKPESPLDTSANRNGIFVKSSKSSGYEKAASEAKSAALQGSDKTPGRVIETFDPTPEAETGTAFVGTSTDYAAFLEFGTSKMPARPYLTPAAESASADFVNLCKRIVNV